MNMKTKRPKKVKITYKEVTKKVSVYKCPACEGIFQGYVDKNIIRFKCSCGQELIVDNGE